MAEIYRQKIMALYRHPLNRGRLKQPNKLFSGANPFCGDKVEISLKVGRDKKIQAASWQGEGCVISQAATSILTEMIKNKTLAQAKKISADQLLKKLGINPSPVRRKCALLPLYTMKDFKDQSR